MKPVGRDLMSNERESVPIGQRIMDNPFLLLAAGLIVMFGFYTLWGVLEVLWLPDATLP